MKPQDKQPIHSNHKTPNHAPGTGGDKHHPTDFEEKIEENINKTDKIEKKH